MRHRPCVEAARREDARGDRCPRARLANGDERPVTRKIGLVERGHVGVLAGLGWGNADPDLVESALEPHVPLPGGFSGYRTVDEARIRPRLSDLHVEDPRDLDDALVVHHLGASTKNFADFGAEWHRNRIAFYRKHFGFLGVADSPLWIGAAPPESRRFVAAVALLNTLTLSVLERRREIGVLRAMGSSRRFTLQMVLAEAAGIGAVAGAAALPQHGVELLPHAQGVVHMAGGGGDAGAGVDDPGTDRPAAANRVAEVEVDTASGRADPEALIASLINFCTRAIGKEPAHVNA